MNDHNHALVDAIQRSGFILAGFIAGENVDLPCFGGPWTDYQCHSERTSNQLHYQFGVQLLGLGPCGFLVFRFPRPMQSFVPCRADNG